MKPFFATLLAPYHAVSILGMCKNAGKTTVLNQMIAELNAQNIHLGLTSVGRDGEAIDLVTGTKKPGIYIREGTLIATASKLLPLCDITRELIDTTGIDTPLGEIVVARAQSDGFVQLAGPSITSQLATISQMFRNLGADKVIIDGAISRKSIGSPSVAEATILCTGASYHRDIDTVVADTAYSCRLLLTGKLENDAVYKAIDGIDCKVAILDEAGNFRILDSNLEITHQLSGRQAFDYSYIFINGALTDTFVKPLLQSDINLKNKCFVVSDSSKILIRPELYEKILIKGARIETILKINLLAVTINPVSAYGFHFHRDEFFEKMQAAVAIPVIDVEKEKIL